MGNSRYAASEAMDKGNSDFSIFIRHLEVHNKTEGKSPRTVEWYNEVLGLLYVWWEGSQLSTCFKMCSGRISTHPPRLR